jgi:ATP-binding cassette, subfamily G (WHITE), eye pigment precursor transporter
MIGDEKIKGLSGGEKKRTSIAVELVTNPKILFLDEPTSGLDSFTANKIVRLLVDFANKGKTVIATIHQPNSETFKLFPSLLLLMDGFTIYHGPTLESVDYFASLGFHTPEYSNPADYYLKEFYVPFIKDSNDDNKIQILKEAYESQIKPNVLKNNEEIRYDSVSERSLFHSMVRVNWFYEFVILFKRAIYNIIFHPMIIKAKLMAYTVMAFACISLFWNLDDNFEGIRSKLGAMLFMLCVFSYGPVGGTIMSFYPEKPVFLKEYSNKTYGLLSYGISKSIVEMPFEAI